MEKEYRCKYCGAKLKHQYICNNCYEKLSRIRKLKAILDRIKRKESGENA